jgi:hypothetical protein
MKENKPPEPQGRIMLERVAVNPYWGHEECANWQMTADLASANTQLQSKLAQQAREIFEELETLFTANARGDYKWLYQATKSEIKALKSKYIPEEK